MCIFKLSWNVFIWLGRLAWHLVWDEYKSVIYAVFYRVLLSKDDFPRESISFIFPQLNIESRKLRVPRDISLGPRSTASWCLLAAPHTQKMRAYFSATSTQSTTQGGDLLRKRMTYDFSLLDFFSSPKGQRSDNNQDFGESLDYTDRTVKDTLDRWYQITFRLYCTYKCHLARLSAKMRVLPP